MSKSQSPHGSWQSGLRPSLVSRARHLLWLVFVFLAVATVIPFPTYAAVSVRVEARPISAPITAHVTVTNASGGAVTGLTADDFLVLVDGGAIAGPSFSLPPAQDSNQKVSVVLAMDYSASVQSGYLAPMQEAVKAFINAMRPGDFAAIVKFNDTNPNRALVVQPFTQIDGADGTAALINAVNGTYTGEGSNVLDATLLSVQQLASPSTLLPSGPKAVVLVSDGGENSSNVDINSVVQSANAAKISIFTVGVGNFTKEISQQVLTGLADETGAKFYPAPTDTQIGQAYVQVSQLLNNEYLLSFQSGITDCNSHTLEVQVAGQAPATATFTRCTPLFAPDVRGQTLASATTELNALGLVVGSTTDQANTIVPAGSVVSQNPTVGAVVSPGSAVNLVVSIGVQVMPDVVGKTQSAAEAAIKDAGLIPAATQEWSSTVLAGKVISQSGTSADPVTGALQANFVVSAGPLAGGGGGGGGAIGPFELLAGLLLVAALVMPRKRKV